MSLAVIWSVPDVQLGIQLIVLKACENMRVNVPYVLISVRLIVLTGADAGTVTGGFHGPCNGPGQAKHGHAFAFW